MAPTREEAYAACLATLRTTDLDRYLACLLVPEDKRGPLAALYAFSAELARIRDLIREPLPGEVRLQYWRDLIEGQPHGDSQSNPIAAVIIHAITDHRMPRAALAAMTEARIFDLYDDPMPNRNAFEGYAGETSAALIQLGALILDPDNARQVSEPAGHAGIAQLVAGCLLLLPIHMRRGQVYIPGDILSAVGLDAAGFLKGEDRQRIGAALSAFIGYGRDHLAKARAQKPAIAGGTKLAFLTAALAEPVFNRADKTGLTVFEKSIQPSQLSRQWRLWRATGSRMF
jgi:phytoene synthase